MVVGGLISLALLSIHETEVLNKVNIKPTCVIPRMCSGWFNLPHTIVSLIMQAKLSQQSRKILSQFQAAQFGTDCYTLFRHSVFRVYVCHLHW